MKKEYNFGWGDTVVIRGALVKLLPPTLANINFQNTGYPDANSEVVLTDLVKGLIKHQTGLDLPYVAITIGCTGALNAALFVLKNENVRYVTTGDTYFPFYPGIISNSGLTQVTRGSSFQPYDVQTISLVDSPSNPMGVDVGLSADIWDAAYVSSIYGGSSKSQPLNWKIMCGSLGKTFGVNGIRLGYAATKDVVLGLKLHTWAKYSYCGISQFSTDSAVHIMKNLDLPSFESLARSYLEDNRTQWDKVAVKFGQSTPNKGMFLTLELGKIERKTFEKAGIIWQPGSSWGMSDNFARISLGQTRELTKEAVKNILK